MLLGLLTRKENITQNKKSGILPVEGLRLVGASGRIIDRIPTIKNVHETIIEGFLFIRFFQIQS